MVSEECLSAIDCTWKNNCWHIATRKLLFGYAWSFDRRISWYVLYFCFLSILLHHLMSTHIFPFLFFSINLGVYQCHDTGGNQDWTITKKGQIKHHELCLTLVPFVRGSIVILRVCDENENQRWELREGGLIKHSKSNVCLDTRYVQERGLTAEVCNSGLDTQYWRFVNIHTWTDKLM